MSEVKVDLLAKIGRKSKDHKIETVESVGYDSSGVGIFAKNEEFSYQLIPRKAFGV